MGNRPEEQRPDIENLVQLAYKTGGNISEIAEVVGYSRMQVHRWRDKYPEFDKAIRYSRRFAHDLAWDAMLDFLQDREVETPEGVEFRPPSEKMVRFYLRYFDGEGNFRDRADNTVEIVIEREGE